MPILKNPRHEVFAQELAKGETADASYVTAGYRRDRKNAARLASTKAIKGRVAELQAETVATRKMNRERLADFYEAVILARPSEAGPDNPLCEKRMSKAGPYYAFPDKLGAAAALSKQCGWNAPERSEVKINGTIARLFAKLRT